MRRFPQCAIFFAFSFCISTTSSFAGTEITVRGDTGKKLHLYMETAEVYGWSGQVLIEREGQIILHAAYGYADRQNHRPMTLDTPIGIASISKPLTAVAILRLVEMGLLALDDPIHRYLPQLAQSELGNRTIHQLLTHSAGIPGGDIAGTDFEPDSKQMLLERIGTAEISLAGESWRYANGGYNLLALIAEQAAEHEWAQIIESQVLKPAMMTSSGLWSHLPGGVAPAHAYRAWVDQGSPRNWPRNWRVLGAGDLVSTVGDLYQFERALVEGTLISAELLSKARSPLMALRHPESGYGYGWFVDGNEDVLRFEHGGDWLGGYNGLYVVNPSDKLLVIVLSNSSDASGMWMRQAVQKSLIDIANGQEVEMPPLAAHRLETVELEGRFIADDGTAIELFNDGAITWLAAANQSAVAYFGNYDPTEVAGLENARRRTERLYSALLANGVSAYVAALGEDGAPALSDYQSEWQALTEKYGRLLSYDLIGVTRRGGSAEHHVLLEFETAAISMSGVWAEGGNGRLHGIVVRDRQGTPWPFPVAIPVGIARDGQLVAWDLFRDYGIAMIPEENGTLRLRRLADGESIALQRSWLPLESGPEKRTR